MGARAAAQSARTMHAQKKITDRIDRITLLTPEDRSEAPPVPKSVKIELTARCDFECFFCASAMRLRDKADIDPAFPRRILRDLRALGVEEIGLFHLGESFLCGWLEDAVRYAKQECGYPYVFLTTNGRMAKPERVRACMQAGLDSLKFSFNFSGPEQFSDVTGVRARDFWRLVQNLREARRLHDQVAAATRYHCGLYASSIRYDDAAGPSRRASQAPSLLVAFYRGPHYLRRSPFGLLLRPRRALQHGRNAPDSAAPWESSRPPAESSRTPRCSGTWRRSTWPGSCARRAPRRPA